MIFNTLFLFLEKVFGAGSRYLLFFHVLGKFHNGNELLFVKLITWVMLIYVFCHLGSDNYLFFLKKENKNIGLVLLLRFFGLTISFFVWYFFFDFHIDIYVVFFLLISMAGVSLPLINVEAVFFKEVKKIILFRSLPEFSSAIFRIYLCTSDIDDVGFLVLGYFSSEILFGFLNIYFLFHKKYFNFNFNFNFEDLKIVFFSFLSVAILFLFQKGDMLIISRVYENLSYDMKSIIKSQQFFDMSGILAGAAVPILLNSDKKSLQFSKSIILFIPVSIAFFYISIFSLSSINIFNSVEKLLIENNSILSISCSLSFGMISYMLMTYFHLNKHQLLFSILLFFCVIVKVLLFILFYFNLINSFIYVTLFQSIVLVVLLIGFEISKCK